MKKDTIIGIASVLFAVTCIVGFAFWAEGAGSRDRAAISAGWDRFDARMRSQNCRIEAIVATRYSTRPAWRCPDGSLNLGREL
jgi:hypothetical protein